MSDKKKEPIAQGVKDTNKKNINVLQKIRNHLNRDYIDDKFGHLDLNKIPKELLIIGTVEHVLEVTKQLGFGLAKNNNSTYFYNGEYWELIEKDDLSKFLGESAEKIGVYTINSRYFEFRDKLYKQFLSAAYIPTPKVDKDVVKINLENGTFEFVSGETKLRTFNPDDFMTYQLSFKYDPEAEAPMFIKYLNEVLPDVDKQKVLSEYLGSIFIKNGSSVLKEEKALILFGTGANGKSVFFEIISAMLGSKNTSNYTLQSLTNENGYYRAKIGDKLVNYSSEISSKLDAPIFKQLVSGEPIEARLPYGEPFILTQYAKLIFNTNELPKNVEHTHAFFRRFIIINFDVTIPKEEQDKSLHLKIIEKELPGVFNWVLDGLKRLLEQGGFSDCAAINEAIKVYKAQSDNVQMFLDDECYVVSEKKHILIKELYPLYTAYCTNNGFKPLNKINFSKRLDGIGVNIKRMGMGKVAYLVINRATVYDDVPF